MNRQPKSPLLRKKALDALLEEMTTDDYQSLGGHGNDRGNKPYASPEDKGTEAYSLHTEPVTIPPKDITAKRARRERLVREALRKRRGSRPTRASARRTATPATACGRTASARPPTCAARYPPRTRAGRRGRRTRRPATSGSVGRP